MTVRDPLANAVLDFVLRGTFNLFMSLHDAAPIEGDDNEIAGTGYAREALLPTDWAVAALGAIETINPVTFPAAGASWGTVTHVGLYDAATAGNLLWWGPMATPKLVNSGDTVTFPPGNLSGTVV